MSIGPHDRLPDGQRVQVNNKRGVIISSRIADNRVTVHTCKFTEHFISRQTGWKTLVPAITRAVNYSFIQTL